jgi:hypothetical protein
LSRVLRNLEAASSCVVADYGLRIACEAHVELETSAALGHSKIE